MPDRCEFRYDDDEGLDEVVIDNAAFVHLERMDEGHWWLGVTLADGGCVHLQIAARHRPSVTKVDAHGWIESSDAIGEEALPWRARQKAKKEADDA